VEPKRLSLTNSKVRRLMSRYKFQLWRDDVLSPKLFRENTFTSYYDEIASERAGRSRLNNRKEPLAKFHDCRRRGGPFTFCLNVRKKLIKPRRWKMRVTAAASARKDIGFAGRPSSRIGSNNIDSARNTLAPNADRVQKEYATLRLQIATRCLRNVVLYVQIGSRVTIVVPSWNSLARKSHSIEIIRGYGATICKMWQSDNVYCSKQSKICLECRTPMIARCEAFFLYV